MICNCTRRCFTNVKKYARLLKISLFPFELSKNEQIKNQMESVFFQKSFAGWFLKILYFFLRWADGTQSWSLAEKYREENPELLVEANATDFIENSLPILTQTVIISKFLRIPLWFLYFKYPRIVRTYFIFELFINMQEAFMM